MTDATVVKIGGALLEKPDAAAKQIVREAKASLSCMAAVSRSRACWSG